MKFLGVMRATGLKVLGQTFMARGLSADKRWGCSSPHLVLFPASRVSLISQQPTGGDKRQAEGKQAWGTSAVRLGVMGTDQLCNTDSFYTGRW